MYETQANSTLTRLESNMNSVYGLLGVVEMARVSLWAKRRVALRYSVSFHQRIAHVFYPRMCIEIPCIPIDLI